MAEATPQEYPTIIGPDANFKGELTFEKGMRIHGRIEGKITTTGRVHVAKEARLLQEGKLTPSDVAAWKQKRDACTDVHCIDGVFAEANSTVDKSPANIVAAPVMTASEALGPASGALPASQVAAQVASAASQQASSVPVSRQGSAYGVALPQSVPAAASAPAEVSAASANTGAASGNSSSPFFIVPGLLFVIVVLGVGAMMIYRRKRER